MEESKEELPQKQPEDYLTLVVKSQVRNDLIKLIPIPRTETRSTSKSKKGQNSKS